MDLIICKHVDSHRPSQATEKVKEGLSGKIHEALVYRCPNARPRTDALAHDSVVAWKHMSTFERTQRNESNLFFLFTDACNHLTTCEFVDPAVSWRCPRTEWLHINCPNQCYQNAAHQCWVCDQLVHHMTYSQRDLIHRLQLLRVCFFHGRFAAITCSVL